MKDYHLYIASCVPDGGIYHYLLHENAIDFVDKVYCPSPMYLDVSEDNLLAILRNPFSENEESALESYTLNQQGQICNLISRIGTQGVVACHLCRFQNHIYVTNYISGSIFSTPDKIVFHEGSSIHTVRQTAPHPHFVAPAPDGRHLFVVDLGMDAIVSYDQDLHALDMVQVPLGHGARHLAFSEDGSMVFCANELESSVSVFHYSSGKLSLIKTVSVLPNPCSKNAVAAIRVRGDYVYVSNRGDDSISCLQWDGCNLTLRSVTSCGGNSPRDIFIVDDMLFCTNENSNTVTAFYVDGAKLIDAEICLDIEKPVCIVVKSSGVIAGNK